MQQAGRISDYTAVFLNGEIVEDGKTEEIVLQTKGQENRRLYNWKVWIIYII